MVRFKTVLIVAPLLTASIGYSQQILRVRVWNYGGVSSETLREAELEVDVIYGSVGIRFEWLACGPSGPRLEACADSLEPRDLVLRVIANSPRTGSFGVDVLGRAMGNTIADVYSSEVARIAETQRLERYQVYGIAIAHEFGHILLGRGAHTGAGLMSPDWSSADFHAAAKRWLRFDVRQAARIRNAAEQRLVAGEARP